MDLIIVIFIAINFLVLLGCCLYICIYISKDIKSLKSQFSQIQLPSKIEFPSIPEPKVHINLDGLERSINNIPTKVLQSIKGSTSSSKGAVGELIGYLQLKASYDRIIPLGDIADFIGIKFPTIDDKGSVDFIDIKTGKYAKLSKDQKLLQSLIKDKRISFSRIEITNDIIVSSHEDSSR